jgi:hypothetical protein
MKIFCVRIGDKYGPEYETYLNRKLAKYDVQWIREPFDPRVVLQWNKMLPMSLDIDEPVCVMDIDAILVNDYEQVFEYPIERGQFAAHPDWWRRKPEYKVNGGFFKYYPKDCRYIFDKFMSNPQHWQQYYINNGTTTGPVNGEQYFVEDSVNERLELKILPAAWFTRWVTGNIIDMDLITEGTHQEKYEEWQWRMTHHYKQLTGNDYIYMGDEFHPDIKFVHFTHFMNKPHEWKDYNLHAIS